MSIGALGHLGVKQETAFGVEATPPTVFHEIRSESISADNNLITPRYVGGIRGNKRVLPGPFSGEGNIEFDMTPEDCFPLFLKGLLGTVVTTPGVTGVYSHKFTPLQSASLPSWTVQVDAEAGCQNWLGVTFSSLGFTLSPDALIECSLGVVAQTTKEATAAVPTYTTLDPFTAYDVAVSFNGVPDVTFENLKIEISNDNEGVRTLNNQRYISRSVAKNLTVSGSFSLEFSNMDKFRLFWGSAVATAPQKCITDSALQIDITSTCQEIVPASGVYYSLSIVIPSIYFSTGAPNITGPDDRVMMDMAFVTKHDAVAGNSISFTLVNSQVGYPDP
jgi:hypothetical protein